MGDESNWKACWIISKLSIEKIGLGQCASNIRFQRHMIIDREHHERQPVAPFFSRRSRNHADHDGPDGFVCRRLFRCDAPLARAGAGRLWASNRTFWWCFGLRRSATFGIPEAATKPYLIDFKTSTVERIRTQSSPPDSVLFLYILLGYGADLS